MGEVVLILPQGPSLLGHPLLSFKPCSDLMSKYIQTVLRSRWTAVHTWHQNASELSQVITCDWIFASHLLLSVGKLQLHLNRENTHYTLSCLAVLNQLRLGHLRSQIGVQSHVLRAVHLWPRCILMLSVNRASMLNPASLKWNTDYVFSCHLFQSNYTVLCSHLSQSLSFGIVLCLAVSIPVFVSVSVFVLVCICLSVSFSGIA